MMVHEADFIKFSAWMWYDLSADMLAWFDGLQDGDHTRLYGYGFTYMYKRHVVQDGSAFRGCNFGEDYDFCVQLINHPNKLRVRHIKDSVGNPCCLHILHGKNSSS